MSKVELVGADKAQQLLDGAQHGPYTVTPDEDEAWLVMDLADADVATVFRNGDDPAVDRGNADLLAASWSLGETVIALRAILEGRTEPPTDAEIGAHYDAEGGQWLVTVRWYDYTETDTSLLEGSDMRRLRERPHDECTVLRCIPLDWDGRPCAWPTVTP